MLTILLLVCTTVYVFLGGLFIHLIETEYEAVAHTKLANELDQQLQHFHNNNDCVNRTELYELLKLVVKADWRGVEVTENVTSAQWTTRWDLYHAMFFIITTLATIGYGNIAPESAGGQAFTVLYTVVGIPLLLATLGAIGIWLSRTFDRCLFRPCSLNADQDRSSWSVLKHIARLVANFASFLVFFACIPAVIFSRLEEWTFGEGVYYAWITLTTIGLGDYEAGFKSVHHYGKSVYGGLYKLAVAIWILIGLVSCASVIATTQDTYSAIARRIRDKFKAATAADDKNSDHPRRIHRGSRVCPAAGHQSDNDNYHDHEICTDDRIYIT